jgi:adenine-specific DNA-methyltransferase
LDEIVDLNNVEEGKQINAVCDYLSNLPLVGGFIYNNYATGGTINQEHVRLYFSDENAKICDTIRIKIEEWKNNGKINDGEFTYLLACLLNATDQKANTASVYGAFLKSFKKAAQNLMSLKPADFFFNNHKNTVYNSDMVLYFLKYFSM